MSSPTQQHSRTSARFIPGAGLAILGSVIALAGVGLLAAFGTDGRLDSGPHRLATPSAAIVSSVASIKNTSGVASLLGQPRLRVAASSVQGRTATFVGIGPTADVDRYLAGVSTDQVTGLTVYPYSINSALHNGRADAPPPATQHFWVAQASSTRAAAINWKIRDGRYRVVIMSADGRGGLAASSALGVTLPHMPRYAMAALLLGLLIAGGGTALLIRATTQPRDRSTTTSPATSTAAAPTL
ncbi:MAG: hypothetical protein ACJ780_20340 [Solirubrobacteraceae bacterium]